MFKKFSLGLHRPREDGDGAVRYRQHRLQSAPAPRPSSGLDFSDGPVQHDYLNTQLEALHLEPLVAPFLSPMRRMVISPEQMALAAPRGRQMSVADDARQHIFGRRPSAQELHMRDPDMPGLLSRPVTLNTPTQERDNPFDDPEQNDLIVTVIPRRPTLRRNAISARGRRDLPLRVQALRRSHQQAFADALLQRAMEEAAAEQPPPPIGDSALWRRRRSSPEDGSANAPRLGPLPQRGMPTHQQERLFGMTLLDGQRQPYSLQAAQQSRHTPSPPEEVDPLDDPQVQLFVDAQGRTWL